MLKDRTAFSALLTETEDWLYEAEYEDITKSVFKEKLDNLKVSLCFVKGELQSILRMSLSRL